MRITDFLADYLPDVTRVVEWHDGSLGVEPYLRLARGVAYERRRPGADTITDVVDSPEVLLIGMLGPNRRRHGAEDDAFELLRSLGPRSRCALLFGYPTPSLPVNRLIDELRTIRGQVLQISSLEHEFVHSAAMISRSEDGIAVPRDPFGEPFGAGAADGVDTRLLQRLVNEYVLLDFASRHHRSELFRLAERGSAAGWSHGSHVSGADGAMSAQANVEAARARADQALAEAQKAEARLKAMAAERDRLQSEADGLRAEVERLEGSTSYRLGRLLVSTARQPAAVPRLPVDLLRLWRDRGSGSARARTRTPVRSSRPAGTHRPSSAPDSPKAPQAPPTPQPPQPASAPVPDDARANERRFIAHTALAAGPRTRPVLAAVLSEATAASLGPHAVVNRLGPNDARLLVERTEPDMLLVEDAAFAPGEPWAFAADPAGLERADLLLRLVDQVHAMGRTAVLARDRRSVLNAGLVPLEPRFDLVLDAEPGSGDGIGWSRGVPLERFNPIGGPDRRDPTPLFLGPADHRAPVLQRRFTGRALAALTDAGLEQWLAAESTEQADGAMGPGANGGRTVRWVDRADLFRSRVAVLANPVTLPDRIGAIEPRILEQLAAGTRVLSGPNRALHAAFGDDVTFVEQPDAFGEALRRAIEDGPPTPTSMRRALRVLFQRHASPVMLAGILGRTGSAADPLASRSATIVAAVGDPAEWGRFAVAVLDQVHRPCEAILLVEDPAEPEAAIGALHEASVPTRVLPRAPALTWGDVAGVARGEWLCLWPTVGPPGAAYLLDLAIGAEMSRADGVGYDDEDTFRYRPVIDPARGLVRRSILEGGLAAEPLRPADTPPASWQRRGARWLAIGPEETG